MGASCPQRNFIPSVAKAPAASQRIARPLGPTFGRDRTISSRASLGCAQAAPPPHVSGVPRLARTVHPCYLVATSAPFGHARNEIWRSWPERQLPGARVRGVKAVASAAKRLLKAAAPDREGCQRGAHTNKPTWDP